MAKNLSGSIENDTEEQNDQASLTPSLASELPDESEGDGEGESVVATKIETSLTISPDSLQLTEGDSAKIAIYTNASDFSYKVTKGDGLLRIRKLDKGLDVTAVKGGDAVITISATVDGGKEKSIEFNLTTKALPVNPSLHKDKILYPTLWPNLKGFVGDEFEVKFPDSESWDKVFITSANRQVAYEKDGSIVLNDVGTTTLTVNLEKAAAVAGGEPTIKVVKVPVWVEAVESNQKIDYDKKAIKDYFVDNMRIEDGYKYGLDEASNLTICELDEDSEAGKQLKSHGLAKAKLEVEDLSQGTVYVKITVASDRGEVNKDTGGYKDPVDVVEVIPHRLVMGYMDKKDVLSVYNRFQALVREQFNR